MSKKNQPEWKPKKVNGKVQRARTYAPGWDVVCVRAPSSVIDKIRSAAKGSKTSISACVAAKFGFKLEGRARKADKSAPKNKPAKKAKAKPAKAKGESNHAAAPEVTETTEGAHAVA